MDEEILTQTEHQEQAEQTAASIQDMPIEVLDGRLGEHCQRYLLPRSPVSYSWPGVVAAAGTLAHQGSRLRTNLFVALVGPIESGKSTTASNAVAVVGLSDDSPELERSMAGSAEGLLRKIGNTGGCARLYSPDELSHLFAKMQIDRASFAPVLQRCFYTTTFPLIIARGERISFSASLSILGGIIDEKFEECFSASTTAGLYDRFVFGLCPKPFQFDFRPFDDVPERLPDPVAVEVDPEIWETKAEWIRTVPGMTGRVAENALRVASICASFDGRSLLRPHDLGPALEFGKHQIRTRRLLQPNPGLNPEAACAFGILRKLDELSPAGEWVPKRSLFRQIHGERFGPGVFRRAGENLIFNEELEAQRMGDTNRLECWRRR